METVASSFPSRPSSSSATPRWEYDVFLSFRGEDTRNNFTDHLYYALKQKGINTFRDDEELEKGKSISSKLLKSIEVSRFAIIVFSKNYADSKWCLDEFAKIVECMKEMEQIVLPVFYDVDPCDVRYQTGAFKKAFLKHEERFKENTEKVKRWKAALTEVANLSGWAVGERPQSVVIQHIVKKIFKILHDTFPTATEGLVGIDDQVEKLNCLLCIGPKDVRAIGIWGMGGIGKTTLAKVVYNNHCSSFEGCSFIKNVKDVSIVQLQQQILYDILKEETTRIWNVESGVEVIKKRLRRKRILLVLDDVNELDQLKYLAEERDWFGSGSRIIITTRDQHLLNENGVDGIYECKELNDDDALKLFCLKAFKKAQPEEGYEKISRKIVSFTNRLPLGLDVLGSFLAKRGKKEWDDALKRLEENPAQDIIKNLEISYDGLKEQKERKIFIYIACFLKGRNQGLVTDILESLDLFPTIGMKVLVEKSLITISDNIVLVHDLLQEMGWEILRKQSPAELGNRIGLKLRKDILDVLTHNEGTKAIEIINQESPMEEVENCTCNPKAFSKMRKLTFLRIHNVYFPQGIKYLSNELRILEWNGYPLKSLPLGFQPKEICELNMRYGQIEKLWEGDTVFPNLRSIDLSCSENLIKPPNLTRFPKIETLDLHDCINLEHTPDLIGTPSLETLDLHGCTKLIHTPNLTGTPRLKTLDLHGCSNLEHTPDITETTSLETLDLHDCTNLIHTPNLNKTPRLKTLDLHGCKNLRYIPNFSGTPSLETLDVHGCTNLIHTPDLTETPNLMTLDLHGCTKLIHTPDLTRTPYLETLDLHDCVNFKHTPDLTRTPRLKTLDLHGCTKLIHTPDLTRTPRLKTLDLHGCTKLIHTPDLTRTPNLETLDLHDCTNLEHTPDLTRTPRLKTLDLHGCTKLIHTPDLAETAKLETLDLHDCTNLENTPNLAGTPRLKTLDLHGCTKLIHTPDLTRTPNLETLDLHDCTNLEHTPDLTVTLKLKTLDLHGCTKMIHTPDLTQTLYLEILDLHDCINLIHTPDLTRTSWLKTLDLHGCTKLIHAPNLTGTPSLEILDLHDCTNLEHAPNLTGTLRLKTLDLHGCTKLIHTPDLTETARLKTLA